MSKLKGQKGFGIVEIFLVLTVIGVLVIAGWLFLGQSKEAEQVIVQPTTIIENVKSSLATKYKLVDWSDGKSEPSQDGEIVYQLSNSSPAYKPDGYNFYVQDYNSGSKGIRLITKAYDPNAATPYEEDKRVRQEVLELFEVYGLNKIDVETYSGNGLVCTTYEPASPLYETNISCGSLSALTERAAQTQPLAKAIPNSDGLTINANIKNSEISGYQYAVASVSARETGGYIAYLYREGVKDWVYWKGAQETPPCKSYDTEILKSAFKGIDCKDENFQDTKL